MRLDVGELKLFGLDLGHAWQWWVEGLRQARPRWLASAFLKPAPTVRAEWDGEVLVVRRKIAGKAWQEIARLERAAVEVAGEGVLQQELVKNGVRRELVQLELVLTPDNALVRILDLPPVDARRLREMLAFQLPRVTPFTADKLYYDAQLSGETGSVVMAAIPRAAADPLIAGVEKVTGLRVSRLGLLDENLPPALNLFGERRVPSRWWRRINSNGVLLALVVVSLMLAAVMPLYAQHQHLVERQRQIAAVQTTVTDTVATREMLENHLHILDATLQARRAWPVTAVFAELSRIVPDTVYLTEMRLQGDEVHFSGSGSAVVELIDLLNASALFTEARFTSSVTRNPRTGQDQFTAAMRLRPWEIRS